jgi:uncharacterized ferritin-like protein (DUF455 family)
MELRDLAERIVFGTTLDDKLGCPDVITDEHPGQAVAAPGAPGRPAPLRFKTGGGVVDFPGLHQLEHDRERGQLLHFFANHELLATELMALVLLRFPDAPRRFRLGVLNTLRDEQSHTRAYLSRMRECGVEFGDLPVSGYFWRSVAPMEHPIDYVAGLCLTFEQANLDFCRQFARGFETVGDRRTAEMLEGIYRDEIGHVAYGLKWFRRWKDPGLSDWDAFCRQLRFPLSPSRAKGVVVNVEGRRAAGLDPEFIDELNIFSQSKGRTPVVFVFNPLAEGFVREGRRFTPRKHSRQLAEDLANLPQFLCRRDDVVLVPRRPSTSFLSEVKSAGYPLPEFVTYEGTTLPKESPLRGRKLGGLRPWAWAPDSFQLLEPLFSQVGPGARFEEAFSPRVAALYSKAWSAEFLARVLAALPEPGILCPPDAIGVVAHTAAEVKEAIGRIRDRGHHRVVVKEGLGHAGQGHLRLWEPAASAAQQRWIQSTVEQGSVLVVEPWLERVADFSIQLESGPGGLRLVGYTGMCVDARGQFLGNWAETQHGRRPPDLAVRALGIQRDAAARLHGIFQALLEPLASSLAEVGFHGPLGMDAFVYRDPVRGCLLKPVVEINPRYTMGRLTLELMAGTASGSHGRLRILNRTMVRAAGFPDFPAYAQDLRSRFPLQFRGDPVPRISSGVLCLNDPMCAKACLATFEVWRPGSDAV